MALSLKSSVAAVAAFVRSLGSTAVPLAGEGILGAHLEDLNGNPLALKQAQALNANQYGLPLMLQNDGSAIMARGDRFGGIATAAIQPLFSWMVEGAVINTRLFNPLATTMAATQNTQGVTLNSAATTTATTNYQLNTFKTIPFHTKAPVIMRARFRANQWGVANANIEFGYANVSTTLGAAANINGAFWRIDSNGVMPVLAISGVSSVIGTDVSAQLVNTNFYIWDIVKDDDAFIFTVQNSTTGVVISRQTLTIPSGAQKAFVASHGQPYIRVFNLGTAVATASQVLMSEWFIGVVDANMNMTPAQIATAIGLGSEYGPLTYTTTSNIANSSAATTTTPTNTTATTTTLDGAMRFAAPAGAATDLALFTYQVPAPYAYRCKGIRVAVKNLGAAVATTATQVDLFICVNASAVTLSGNLNRKYIGTQTFPVGAAIGSAASEGVLTLDLNGADLVVEPGRYITLVARISTGTATASQVLEVMYNNIGHFE